MTKLVNRAKMTTATTGTGTITLGAASSGYQSFADAGVADSDVVRYVIEDGVNWEIGTGTYTASGTTLSRTVSESSNSDTAITLSGNAVVYITAVVADILQPDNNLSDLTSASTARTNLGLGSIATQDANNVNVSGGSITGITDLAVSDGGTGASSFTANNVLLGNGTSAFQVVAPGTSGNVLTSNGTTWASATPVTGATSINGLSDAVSAGNVLALGDGAFNDSTPANTFIRSTAVGIDAMRLGAVSTSTAVGTWALYNATGGGDHVAVGAQSLFSATTAVRCVALGESAGLNLTTGNDNIAVGRYALAGNSSSKLTGARNTGIGYQTGYLLSTGADNFLVGYQTGYSLSSGADNFLAGYQSGSAITTGSNNVAIGRGALDAATTGGRNIAIGQNAMGSGIATNASGDHVAIGVATLFSVTSGRNNVALGQSAGGLATTASDNIFIGRSSGGFVTSGSYNVTLGTLAGDILTTGTNNIVIGYQADASSATVSNEITLGNTSITNFRVPGVGLQFDTTDGLIVPKTITAAGTTGAQTINKTAGSVNFAAAATSLVVTNSFVDANSVIIATVATNDTTMTSVQAVAAAGSFTLYANAAATAETRVNWFVVN